MNKGIWGCRSASLDVPLLLLCDPADAGPAVMLHGCEVFEAFEVHGDISSFLTGSLLADGESLVDVVDASDLQVVGAFVGEAEGEQGEQQHEDLDHW